MGRVDVLADMHFNEADWAKESDREYIFKNNIQTKATSINVVDKPYSAPMS